MTGIQLGQLILCTFQLYKLFIICKMQLSQLIIRTDQTYKFFVFINIQFCQFIGIAIQVYKIKILACFYSEDTDRVLSEKEVMVTTGRLRAGFEFPELKLVVINEGDVFTARSSRILSAINAINSEFVGLPFPAWIVYPNNSLIVSILPLPQATSIA